MLSMETPTSKDEGKKPVSVSPTVFTPKSEELNNEFITLLMKTRVQDLRPSPDVIYVANRDDSVMSVWRGLVRHKFLSCPVVKRKQAKYHGFIDLADIALFIIENFGQSFLVSSEDYYSLISKEEAFLKKTVKDVMRNPKTQRNPFHPVYENYSVMSAMELLARERGLHRVPVIDRAERIVGLISQSQLIHFILRNIELLGNKRFKTLDKSPHIFKKKVISVNQDVLAYEAFKSMVNWNVSGVAVVDDYGKLVGNLSLRDLKPLASDLSLFVRLYDTVGEFLSRARKEDPQLAKEGLYCFMNEQIQNVIRVLAQHNVHRIYIVDDNKKPIGVASLKDVLLEILS